MIGSQKKIREFDWFSEYGSQKLDDDDGEIYLVDGIEE